MLDTSEVDPAAAGAVIGVAGTVTTIAAGVLDLAAYDAGLIHHTVLRTDAVQGQVASAADDAGRAAQGAAGYMHPGRVDVIGAGGLILIASCGVRRWARCSSPSTTSSTASRGRR